MRRCSNPAVRICLALLIDLMNAGTKKDGIVSSFFVSRQSIAWVIEFDRLQAVGLCARFG